jgi:lysophospholipase L1-like esterase
MDRIKTQACRVLLIVVALQACLYFSRTPLRGQGTAHPRRIAVFGSSVAFGTGDETNKEGYTGLLRELLAPRGWEVFNQSRPGDTTRSAASRFAPEGAPAANTRYLMTVNPGYAVIALALTNEGILEAKTAEEKEAVFKQYADGIRGLVERSRQNNIVPIVGLVYPRMSYTPVEYEYATRMNLLLNSWDVPSVNLMGALDDGTGRYTIGFDSDDRHPNAAGHRELFHAWVPSLFEALEKGKPKPSRPSADSGFARVSGGNVPLSFEPQDAMHSFALSFSVRAQGDSTIAAIAGSILSASTETKRGGRGAGYESTTLTPAQDFVAAITIQNGKWSYKPASGSTTISQVNADAQWHQILLSHYTARGETSFFVDGKLAGKVSERLQPKRFVLGGPDVIRNTTAPQQADYKDLLVYRSAVNAAEASAIASGTLLQASLEIYAPLNDARFTQGAAVENRAQSMSALKAAAGRIEHVSR